MCLDVACLYRRVYNRRPSSRLTDTELRSHLASRISKNSDSYAIYFKALITLGIAVQRAMDDLATRHRVGLFDVNPSLAVKFSRKELRTYTVDVLLEEDRAKLYVKLRTILQHVELHCNHLMITH